MADPQTHVHTIDLIALETNSIVQVGSTSVAYSKSFLTPNFESAAVEFQFDSPGSVDVRVEIESGAVPPTTEGAADTVNYGVGNILSTGITSEAVQWIAPSPTVSKYLRFKLTGQGANNASTELRKLKLHYTPND